jgi:hypothetical protein
MHTVFDIYSTASQAWWAGDDMFLRQQTTGELYRYSPAFAVLTSPFAMLSPGLGNALWKFANAGIFAFGLLVWCRRGLPTPLSRDQIAAVFLLAIPAASGSLYIGQANLMMTGFVLLGLTALAEERWWRAAGYITAATFLKVSPLALAMVVGVLYWRTFPLRFLVTLLAGLAIPFLAQSPEYVLEQTRHWFQHLGESVALNRDRLRSVDNLMEVVGFPLSHGLFMLCGAVAGGVVLLVTVGMQWRGAAAREILLRLASWFLTWVVLFSPSSENVTFSILAPVVAWGVVDAFLWPRTWLRRVWLLASLYMIGLSYGDPGAPLIRLLGADCGATIGALMFQATLIVDLFKSKQPRL